MESEAEGVSVRGGGDSLRGARGVVEEVVECLIIWSANGGAGPCCGVVCLEEGQWWRGLEERKYDVMGGVGFVRLACAIVGDLEEVGI